MLHRLFSLLACLLFAGFVLAEDAAPPPEATLTLAGRDIVTLHATVGGLTPEQRVARAESRVRALGEADLARPVLMAPFSRDGVSGLRFYLNNKPLFALTDGDLDAGDSRNLLQVGDEVKGRLEALRAMRVEQGSPRAQAWAIGQAVGASLLLALALALISRARGRARARLLQKPLLPKRWFGAHDDLGSVMQKLEQHMLDLTALVGALLALHLWLSFILTRFPYTRPWGERLAASLFDLLASLGEGLVGAVPGLAKVALILVLTRLGVRTLGWVFDAVEDGRLTLPGLYKETVGATRRLTTLVLWLFALTVAYPYLPGSSSDAFKGVSVFFGLMVTLGSTGIMNHAMSGLVLVYARALKPGDLVQVGDTEGFVTELGALSTKVRTRHGNEVTLPNSVVVGGKVVNYTRQAGETGLPLTTKITIGYDTPWRQVHALLELAARRTEGLRTDSAPIVRQLSLQDFYVEYELEVRMPLTASPPAMKTALHAQILDAFNEFGVQIMSPNFENQPEGAVLVGKGNWYAAPAEPPGPAGQA